MIPSPPGRLVAASVALVALAACVSVPPSTQASLVAAEAKAEAAYSGLSTAYLQDSASWSPTTKATVKGLLLKMLTCSGPPATAVCSGYLPAARAAVDAADAKSVAAQVAWVSYLACLGAAAVANVPGACVAPAQS